MKIRFIAIAFVFLPWILLACGAGADSTKKSVEPQEEIIITKNKVRPKGKAIRISKEFKISPEDEVGTIQSEIHFDESGNKVKVIQYDYYGSGEVDSETNYSYDEKGNKVEMNDGTTKTVYEYNDKNQKTKETWSRANGQGAAEEFSYDDRGEWIESKYYDAKGTYDFSRVREISYDEKGNIIEEKQWEKYSDGSADLMQFWIKYSFGSNGKVESKMDLREDGKESSKEVYKYDGAGNTISSMGYDMGSDTPESKEVMEYNEYGEVIESQTFNCDDNGDCNSLQYTNEYKCDEFGRDIWQMYVHTDGDAWGSRWEYEYYE